MIMTRYGAPVTIKHNHGEIEFKNKDMGTYYLHLVTILKPGGATEQYRFAENLTATDGLQEIMAAVEAAPILKLDRNTKATAISKAM